MMPLFRFTAPSLALALALSLTACGKTDAAGDGAAVKGDPVATVAAPQGQAWSDQIAVTADGGYLMGNPAAPLKLVEYGSLTCPACAAFGNTGLQPLTTKYVDSGRVSYEFRSLLIHGSIDLALTRLIGCGPKETAIPLAEQIWANLPQLLDPMQQNADRLERAMQLPEDQRFVAFAESAGLFDFFAARGLSRDQAQQCLADPAAIRGLAVQSDALGERDNVSRTPTFFLNGTMLDDTAWDKIEPALQRAGAR